MLELFGSGFSTMDQNKGTSRKPHPRPVNEAARKHEQVLRAIGINNFSDLSFPYYEGYYDGEDKSAHNSRRQRECEEMRQFLASHGYVKNTKGKYVKTNITNSEEEVSDPSSDTEAVPPTPTEENDDMEMEMEASGSTSRKRAQFDEDGSSGAEPGLKQKSGTGMGPNTLKLKYEKERQRKLELQEKYDTAYNFCVKQNEKITELEAEIATLKAKIEAPIISNQLPTNMNMEDIKKYIDNVMKPVLEILTQTSKQKPTPKKCTSATTTPRTQHTQPTQARAPKPSSYASMVRSNTLPAPVEQATNEASTEAAFELQRSARKRLAKKKIQKPIRANTVLLLPSAENPVVVEKLKSCPEANPRTLGVTRMFQFPSGAALITCKNEDEATKLKNIAKKKMPV